MKTHYNIDKTRNEMYFVRTYPQDRQKIEMSFDLTHYQPHAKAASGGNSVYQTIFLDKRDRSKYWTIDKIDKSKILHEKWWR